MDEPKVAQAAPYALDLEPGRYYWCQCGLSAKQPFCDGSHQGSECTPMAFVCSESKDYFLCQCKHIANKPDCDGSHNASLDDQVGKPAP